MKVLIIEDDPVVAELVKESLKIANTVEVANDGADGSFLARSFEYDIIILDYSLPKKNGLQICDEIRASGKRTPILFLSATGDVATKVLALEHGADDYMTKPFSLQELEARLKAISRRPAEITKQILTIDDLELDTKSRDVRRGSTSIHLTRKEFNLLEYLMRNKGTVVSRALLLEHVWTADSDPFSNTLEAHVRNVRKKLNVENKPDLIVTVPGRGYLIDTPTNLSRISGTST